MTVWELVNAFQAKLEIISDQFRIKERPDTDTILSFLNMAQEKYFNDKYIDKGSSRDIADFLNRIASDDLVKLIQTTGALTLTAAPAFLGHTNTYTYQTAAIPQYARYIDSYCLMYRTQPKVVGSAGNEEWTINEMTDSLDDLKTIETNWYNKPILRKPVVFLDGSDFLSTSTGNYFYIYLIADEYTTLAAASNFNMRYLRKPKALDFTEVSDVSVTTPELATHTHEYILQLALDLFKEQKFTLNPKS